MEDHEIATKKLSDWKPETDIKLQKAFGKFVEEVGELLEIGTFRSDDFTMRAKFENEVADCYATIDMIDKASERRLDFHSVDFSDHHRATIPDPKNNNIRNTFYLILVRSAGQALNIVGRCQIQGIGGFDPETKRPNLETLRYKLSHFKSALSATAVAFELDKERIETRKQAKIDSKLPWVMGTATDLLPDKRTLNRQDHPAGTKVKLTHRTLTAAPVVEVTVKKWASDPDSINDVLVEFDSPSIAPGFITSRAYWVVD